MSDKKSRKELLKQDDAFLHAAAESATWAKHHRTIVIGGSLALVALIGGIWGGIEYIDSRDKTASRLFAQAQLMSSGTVVSAGEAADASASPPKFASEDEKQQKTREAFQKVIAEVSGSGVADLARFYLADADAKANKLDEALRAFEDLASRLSADDSLYFLAVERAAYLHEQKGDKEAALRAWEKLTGSAKRFYADHALFQLARLQADKGDKDKARELLGRLEKDFPGTSLGDEVEQLYAQVGRPEKTAAAGAEKDEGKKASP